MIYLIKNKYLNNFFILNQLIIFIYQTQNNKQYSRTMEIITNITEIHQINISLQLQTLQLNNLYLLTKKIIYKFNIQQLNITITNHSILKGYIVQIIQFVVSKIKNNTKLSLDKFVVYISIFSYICSMLKHESFGIQLTEIFYYNLRNYIQQIIKNSVEKYLEKEGNVVKGHLSIILCCLSSLTKEQKLRYPRIDLAKIFNSQLIKKIISLKLPNLQKLMKYYKSLILYLTKIKLTLNQRQQLIKSIYYHFVNCSDFYQTQITLIFCLSSLLQDKKIYSRIQTILVEKQKNNILSLSFEYLRKCNQPSHFSMIIDLCQKLIRGMEEIEESLLDGMKFYSLYMEIHSKFGNAERLPNFLQRILSKISSNSSFYVYKQISQKQTLLLSQLQIIYVCTKKISHQFLFYILNSDKWQKYLTFSKIKQNSHTNYKRYLVQKIIINIIKSSQSNSDLHSVLKNLSKYSG